MPKERKLLAFREAPGFTPLANVVLGIEGLTRAQDDLIDNPERGPIEPGTGGARKLRVSLDDRGKSFGARVMYYYPLSGGEILLVTCFDKRIKKKLSPEDKDIIKQIVATYDRERRSDGDTSERARGDKKAPQRRARP